MESETCDCELCKSFNGLIHNKTELLEDKVNHPKHYNNSDAKCKNCKTQIECIDVARHLHFNIGNAIKYLWRYENKNGMEDLKKAIWYINDEIEKIKESEKKVDMLSKELILTEVPLDKNNNTTNNSPEPNFKSICCGERFCNFPSTSILNYHCKKCNILNPKILKIDNDDLYFINFMAAPPYEYRSLCCESTINVDYAIEKNVAPRRYIQKDNILTCNECKKTCTAFQIDPRKNRC